MYDAATYVFSEAIILRAPRELPSGGADPAIDHQYARRDILDTPGYWCYHVHRNHSCSLRQFYRTYYKSLLYRKNTRTNHQRLQIFDVY